MSKASEEHERLMGLVGEYRRGRTCGGQLSAAILDLCNRNEELRHEVHRHVHGITIESDHICEYELAHNLAHPTQPQGAVTREEVLAELRDEVVNPYTSSEASRAYAGAIALVEQMAHPARDPAALALPEVWLRPHNDTLTAEGSEPCPWRIVVTEGKDRRPKCTVYVNEERVNTVTVHPHEGEEQDLLWSALRSLHMNGKLPARDPEPTPEEVGAAFVEGMNQGYSPKPLAIGDRVQLKSGGPVMDVHTVTAEQVWCQWGKGYGRWAHPDMLKRVEVE